MSTFYLFFFSQNRNFLVGSGAQSSDNADNEMSASFSQGRALSIMVATWNTGEAPNLYEQNYTPTARQRTHSKEQMLGDMSDIILPTSVTYVADLIIICTQEMSVAKNR